ncbi:CYFA0S13e03862g1_1 [Cyberlindnera fabianii]|uniref:CYFA0S13e03862g1_1 n=1 Tax=Cyberlindnera fabianii TaxID=36022 RepID=A0A061BB06_CYBFA|nr:CYFA0S13e03862g1_1 [Cyberlindnera fabianii]
MELDENPWADDQTVQTRLGSSDGSDGDTAGLKPPFMPSRSTINKSNKTPAHRQPPQRSPAKQSYIGGQTRDLVYGVCIVNFHHLRGPEIEYSNLAEHPGFDLSSVWPYLPFQALPDGAHSFEETFSCFTLQYPGDASTRPTTLFAISCARQIASNELLEKDKDVTRSSVQKAIVVILKQPIYGQIKEKLSIVTKAFFEQKNFADKVIVDVLFQSLQAIYSEDATSVDESDFYAGLSLRELVRDFKKDVLTVIKAMMLEKKIAFYGSDPTKLCATEFAFISLIPNLINNLLDCSSPSLDNYTKQIKPTSSFQTPDRNSVLAFAGLPLQIFGEGGVFSPYSPLQQFEELKKVDYYLMGTSNALLLNQKQAMCDVLVNLDTSTVEVINHDLIQPLQLTSPDKKWMSQIVSSVSASCAEGYSGFLGSDDYIRLQFEDYLTGFLASVKYNNLISRFDGVPPSELVTKEYDHSQLKYFNVNFVNMWKQTHNYSLFNRITDDHLFDVFEPRHIYVEEGKSLSERFQVFKMENTKKFDDYRKGLLAKESKDNLKLKTDLEKVNDPSSSESAKSKSPGKLWGWYSRRKERDSDQ